MNKRVKTSGCEKDRTALLKSVAQEGGEKGGRRDPPQPTPFENSRVKNRVKEGGVVARPDPAAPPGRDGEGWDGAVQPR